jgi:insertion element IS1 protein InsB
LASKKVNSQPNLKESLLPAQEDDVLELDELWSFVRFRKNKRWIWIVLCRRTRQIVAFVIGDRSARTCQKLWKRIPRTYRSCHSYSDFWEAYEKVFPEETHRSVGKESGQTNHVERWNCTLRQKVARFVRKTLSFSKADYMHHIVTRWFIVEYNLQIIAASCT